MALSIDMKYVLDLTEEIIAIPSVSGDCKSVNDRLAEEFKRYGLDVRYTPKGGLIATMDGTDSNRPAAFVGAHSDTLGAVVRYIKPNGRIRLFPVGGYGWQNVEGENCTVKTSSGKLIRGTVLNDKASRHAWGEECDIYPRTNDMIEVRLDAETSSIEETRALGIQPGDFVYYDPRFHITERGFVKSRFVDDKAIIGAMFGAIKAIHDSGLKPKRRIYFNISNYEEIGHGVSEMPGDVNEIVSLDIAIVSPDNASDEHSVSVFARDRITPYDISFRERLLALARENGIRHHVDAFCRYSSDASQFVRRGGDCNFAGFGPGCDASHHYERTHKDGLEATAQLTAAYILD